MNEKEQRLAEFCRARKLDGVVLRRRSNIAWLTDGADTHIDLSTRLAFGTVLWTPSRKTLYADVIEAPRFREEELKGEWSYSERPWMEDEPPIEGNYATDWPNDEIASLRYSLTADEVKRMTALGAETAEIFCKAIKEVRSGDTEHRVAALISGALREAGIFTPVMLVASDERIRRYRHPIPTGKRIERQVIAAVCAERQGLVVSMTRVVHFGAIPAELRRRHDAVCAVDAAYHAATTPGARWCDALAAGLAAYERAGFGDEWRKHHQGGPMGYELRDFKATPTETRVVEIHQPAGWNPTITGTKSEDTILSGASGGEVLTNYPDWPTVTPTGGITRSDILSR